MGAALSTGPATSGAARSALVPDFLAELGGEVQYEKSMGASRFLKTIRARHARGAAVVKVFIKPDPSLSLQSIQRRLKVDREALLGCPNVLTYQRTLETERAGYALRQWVASNLYDRISTRPFLSSVEKKWIAFQLLTGLKNAHERDISHGDIKAENVLVTSWNWVYLTDFASFKPTYLPLDDPATFSFFFDTSSRRTCYLAPERFYTPTSEMARKKQDLEWGKRDGKVTEAMDVFGLGCVLAELWMEGTPPFTLSQLFKYREGEYSPEPYLSEIEDVEIRNLIRSMISLDPAARMTCSEYLASNRTTAFPDVFYDFLHPFISSLNESTATSPSPPTPTPPQPVRMAGISTPTVDTTKSAQPRSSMTRSEADDRIERIWNDWEVISGYLNWPGEDRSPAAAETSKMGAMFPLHIHIPGAIASANQPCTEDPSALIVLSLVCSNMRNCSRPSSILRGFEILLSLSRYLTDEDKLDRLVPYLVSLLQDDVAIVRSGALKALTQTLILVDTIASSNSAIFTEYILPNTRPFSNDPELLPRITYAECISVLADSAKRFLDMTEAVRTEATVKLSDLNEFDGSPYEVSYETNLQELQVQVQEHVNPLLTDPSAEVKRALLCHVASLCTFFGRLKANDGVLSHLVTYLNTRDWQLRRAFNEHSISVVSCVGPQSLEEYILPLITLSLSDAEETVVAQVLESLTLLTERRLLARGKMWELVAQITGFLCHPNIWIREGAAAFLAGVSMILEPTDRWCNLYPTIKRSLRADIREITELTLLDNAREPIPRVIFEAAVAWAGRSSKSRFWSVAKAPVKGAPRDASARADEDNSQMEKMRQLGMTQEDEHKLSMMRDYISKLASSRSALPSRIASSTSPPSTAGPVLQDLGVVPQMIFFGILPVEEGPNVHGLARLDSLPRRFSTETRSVSSFDHLRSTSGPLLSEDLRKRLTLGGTPASSVDGEAIAPALRFVSTYEGNDPSIKQLLERVYLDTFRPLPADLGPHVPVGIPRRKALRTNFPPRETVPERPEGTLIAHLVEHTDAITAIAVAPDQLFFVTGSADGTIKVWDTIRLEKNVTSRSRQTFAQGGRVTAVCVLENSHCVASASDNGTVWVHRVDISLSGLMPKYSKQHLVRQYKTEEPGEFVTTLLSYNTNTTTNLVLCTSLSAIVIVDLRTMQTLQRFLNPIHFGPLTCVCVDKSRIWLVIGTAAGTLSLWDLRFGLLLRSWTIGSRRIHQVDVHPSKGKGRWIVVAAEEESVASGGRGGTLVSEVWDIDQGLRVEEFRVVGTSTAASVTRSTETPVFAMQDAILDPAAAIEALLASTTMKRTNTEPDGRPRPGVRAFLQGASYAGLNERIGQREVGTTDEGREAGYLITAGSDRKLRFWDLGRPERSAVVSGLELDEEKPVYTVYTSTTRPTLYLESPLVVSTAGSARSRLSAVATQSAPKIHRSTLIANAQQHLLRGHQNAITALGMIELPFKCIVSGDQGGAIKVFE